MKKWVSRPDEVDALVEQWRVACPELLTVESRPQFTGRPVWALTVTAATAAAAAKRKALFYKPHAHEPAPVAAQMNLVAQLLTGRTLDGQPTTLDRERILTETLLCFIPDANPAGTAAAPVEAWDGSQYTNEEFWGWMGGVDPQTGKMWPRVDLWDERTAARLPERYGLVYEQISAHEYVEPNRHRRSTLMQWLYTLQARYSWDRMLELHQMEFEGQRENCMVILPCLYHQQPPERQAVERRWAERLGEEWGRVAGGRPMREVEPLGYSGAQRQYFINTFKRIYMTNNLLITEIQNNSPQTPPALQQQLNETAITATITDLLDE